MSIGILLMMWHNIALINYDRLNLAVLQNVLLVLSLMMSVIAITQHGVKGMVGRYLESLIDPLRSTLVGFSTLMMGCVHFLTFYASEPIYLQMGFMVILLAYWESASTANQFWLHAHGEVEPTRYAMRALLVNHSVQLAIVFILSVAALLVSRLAVVGFTNVWTVLILSAILFSVIALLTRIRKV